jgi:hypothetical protein
MSIIKANFNFQNDSSIIQRVGVLPGTTEIHFIFTSDSEFTYFDNLTFGYQLKNNNEIIQEEKYPLNAETHYEMTNNYPLVIDFLHLEVEKRYELIVFAEDFGKKLESYLDFVTPRPLQPYPSWIWNNNRWEAPVGPEDDDSIIWNEDQKKWIRPDLPRLGQ